MREEGVFEKLISGPKTSHLQWSLSRTLPFSPQNNTKLRNP